MRFWFRYYLCSASDLSTSCRIQCRYLETLVNTSPWLQSFCDKKSPVRKAVFSSSVATGVPGLKSHWNLLCCNRDLALTTDSCSSIQNILLVKGNVRLSLSWQSSSERYEEGLTPPTTTPSLPVFIKTFSLKSFSGRQRGMVSRPRVIGSFSSKKAKSSSGWPNVYLLWRVHLEAFEAFLFSFGLPAVKI